MTQPASKGSYRKHQSFNAVFSNIGASAEEQRQRSLTLLQTPADSWKLPAWADVSVLDDARQQLEAGPGAPFRITQFIADDLSRLADADVPRYLFHRYRYDIFPQHRRIDDYPPYIQVEPSSICNFRCVFCYQTDETFSRRNTEFMGTIEPTLFKQVIDDIEGNIEFGSLASRGEPLIHRQIGELLAYTQGKFLGLKLNTNASLLTEEKAHAILSSGLAVVVFSADAAKEPDYSNFRVKGSLERTLANVRMFHEVREKHYPQSPVITRVSGVMYDPEHQDIRDMVSFWGDLVDQVAFVAYNPWESIYEVEANDLTTPCSDLWRRLFVWRDGATNPCDTDYKSHLSPGSVLDHSVSEIWRGEAFSNLRQAHQDGRRQEIEPCRRCSVI